jgi:hypothetical protein
MTQASAQITYSCALRTGTPMIGQTIHIGGYRVGCQYESATFCNQHQARMSRQADVPVSMRPCLAGQGRGRCSS